MAAGRDQEHSSVLSDGRQDSPSIPPQMREMEVGRGQADTYTSTDPDLEQTPDADSREAHGPR